MAGCHPPASDILAQTTGEMLSVAERTAVEEGATPCLDPYRNLLSTSSTPASAVPVSRNEKIVISGNGITASLALAEPVVYLPQFDPAYPATARSVMLSGNLQLRLTKAIKIKKVELVFKGTAQTKMSNGVSPKKVQVQDMKELNKHVWPFFFASTKEGFSTSNNEYNADHFKIAKPLSATRRELYRTETTSINIDTDNSEAKGLSPEANRDHARRLDKGESSACRVSNLHRGYKLFPPGDYTYEFEQLIDSHNPETIENEMVSVRWLLQAVVERSEMFQSNLSGIRYIPFIRIPTEGSLEQVEPIVMSRNWKDQLQYDITIFGKSFPFGSQMPIALKLTPFAKVTCHRIQVWVIENAQFHDKFIHHLEPQKRFLLFEKTAHSTSASNYSGSSMQVTADGGVPWGNRAAAARGEEFIDHHGSNLLGNLNDDYQAGPAEMEFNIQLPNCQSIKGKKEGQKLHCDMAYENHELNHWIKIVLRMSKFDEKQLTKRRHFDISIESPFCILSCLAAQSNIDLPAYSSAAQGPGVSQAHECGCAEAATARRNLTISEATSRINKYSTSGAATFPAPSVSSTLGSGDPPRPAVAHLYSNSNDDSLDRSTPLRMHLLRIPSFVPPPFEDVSPTPPPDYATVFDDEQRAVRMRD